MQELRYYLGDELGDAELTWNDSDGTLINFASGWTFSVKVGTPGSAASFTKTTTITGASTAPNVTIAWATTGELNSLTAGGYTLQVVATQTSGSKTRTLQVPLAMLPVVT